MVEQYPEQSEALREIDRSWRKVESIHDALTLGATALGDVGSVTSHRSMGTLSASKVLDDLKARGVEHNRYKVRDELARGGMGAILEAWDQDLRRRVAMKVMLSPQAEARTTDSISRRERMIGRFLEEAQVTGQLEHPSIVPVYELSLDADDRLFFTMPLVRGRDFEQVIQAVRAGEEGWTEQKALRLLLRVCEAMAYAHDKGVVHRDLKPANLMTGNYGEVYVMDWGVARVDRAGNVGRNTAPRKDETLHRVQSVRTDESDQGDSTLSTLDGEVVGTPSYMAPEQARGELDRIGARADVYSIGAILYQLISGVRPYAPPGSKRTVLEVLDLVRESAPEPLVELAPDGNPELVAIATKAMAREPQDRYATMAELADDLGRHLDGYVVSAYEQGRRAEVRKWVRRNRATATWAAVAAGGLILGLAGVTVVQARANRSLERSNYQLGVVIEALEYSEREAKVAAETARVERDASESVVAFLEDLFESPDPSRAQGERVTAKELLDRGASALAEPEQLDLEGRGATRFGMAIGRAYNALGLAEDALPLLERGHEDLVETYGREDAATLVAQVELGDALTALGEFERAGELLDDAVRRSRQEFGSSAESTLLAERGLASVRFNQGQYEEAVELLEHVAERAPDVFGERSVERFETIRLLARVQRKADQLDLARSLLVTAVEGLTDVVGEDDPRTLMALNNLAGIDLFEEDYDAALPRLEQVLEARERVLGADHPDTLITVNDLALLHSRQGRTELAEPLFRRALEDKRARLGRDHPETLTTLNNLGALYFRAGRFDEARPLFADAVAGNVARRGEEHPNTVAALNGLGSIYLEQRRYEDGRDIFDRALRASRVAFGEDHGNTLVIQTRLIQALEALGEVEPALELASDLLERTAEDSSLYDSRRDLLQRLEQQAAEAGQ